METTWPRTPCNERTRWLVAPRSKTHNDRLISADAAMDLVMADTPIDERVALTCCSVLNLAVVVMFRWRSCWLSWMVVVRCGLFFFICGQSVKRHCRCAVLCGWVVVWVEFLWSVWATHTNKTVDISRHSARSLVHVYDYIITRKQYHTLEKRLQSQAWAFSSLVTFVMT